MDKRIKLVEYGIGDFCKKVQEMFDLGYRFDFESNDDFPVNFGTFMECGMVKTEEPSPDDADVLGKTPIDTDVPSIDPQSLKGSGLDNVVIEPVTSENTSEAVVITPSDVGNLSDVLPDLVLTEANLVKPKVGRPKKGQ